MARRVRDGKVDAQAFSTVYMYNTEVTMYGILTYFEPFALYPKTFIMFLYVQTETHLSNASHEESACLEGKLSLLLREHSKK